MLATTTTDTLSVVDSALLKKLSSVPVCLDLIATPMACSWSSDNINLFIASSRTIHNYDSSSNVIRCVYEVEGLESIRALISKEKDIIFSMDQHINILHFHGAETHTVQKHVPHKAPVTSLSLSNDNSLLASASTGVVYVHNIASGSHTVLRGLGNITGSTSVTFHMHFRTRLLVSLARQILIYDTTRPSAPLKTIPLSESSAGDIVALSCSPFSKTLVAVATSLGFVVMIDLEKEKPQLRTVNIKANLTALEFSPEGGSIYLGTDDGKLLVVDLRNLDKPAKVVIVSQIGDPIRTLNFQTKIKMNADGLAKTPRNHITKALSEPLASMRQTTSRTASIGATKSMSKTIGSPVQRAVTTEAPRGCSLKEKIVVAKSKQIPSPVKDPLGHVNDLRHNPSEAPQSQTKKPATALLTVNRQESKDCLKPRPSPSPRASLRSTGRSQSSSKSTLKPKEPRRSRTLPSKPKPLPSEEAKERAILPTHSTAEHLCVPDCSRPVRAVPCTSRPDSDPACGSISALSSRVEQSSRSLSGTATASRPSSSISRPGATSGKTTSATKPSFTVVSSECGASTRTPSPDLSYSLEPLTPASKQQNKKSTGMNVLGLGTPEVERWIKAGESDNCKARKDDENNDKGRSKTVYFKERNEGEDAEEVENLLERARKLSLQISPRRLVPSAPSSSADSWAALEANSPAPSATSHHATTSAAPSSPVVSSTAHDLLKTILQDVMFDFQRETKAEMMGLHLDLLRMGRNWKAELRSLMDEYVGDLREMREENARLRKENERLKRGWQ